MSLKYCLNHLHNDITSLTFLCYKRVYYTLRVKKNNEFRIPSIYLLFASNKIDGELAWRSGSIMDCHATAWGSIPGGNGVFTELHVLRKGQ